MVRWASLFIFDANITKFILLVGIGYKCLLNKINKKCGVMLMCMCTHFLVLKYHNVQIKGLYKLIFTVGLEYECLMNNVIN